MLLYTITEEQLREIVFLLGVLRGATKDGPLADIEGRAQQAMSDLLLAPRQRTFESTTEE